MGALGTDANGKQKFLVIEPGGELDVQIPAGDKYWKAIVNKFGNDSYRYTVVYNGVVKDWDCSSTSVALAIDKLKEMANNGEIKITIKRTVKNDKGKTQYSVESEGIPF